MSDDSKTAGPSKKVINKMLSTKPLNKTKATPSTKLANTRLTQFNSRPTTSTLSQITPPHIPTLSSSTPSSPKTAATPSYDINNPKAHANYSVQNTGLNYASATANENPPSREQALVLNSIEGIPQRDYIVAIGKLISPKNIVFASRISNNRFCIFLSSKQILDSLLASTQTITINEQLIEIRRLINPSKRIVISNVCPSIPNQVILDALKNINITPVSQIVHLKAGINMEGYDHISSFRRQLFINHDDSSKLPGSLPLLHNHTEFRVFFTDGRITCFLCKSTGHITKTCNKTDINPQNTTEIEQHDSMATMSQPIPPASKENETNTLTRSSPNHSFDTPLEMEGFTEEHQTRENTQRSSLNPTHNTEDPQKSSNEPSKRPLSDTSSQTISSPSPPITTSTTETNNDRSRSVKKKAKIDRSRSNSTTNSHDKIALGLKPAEDIFTENQHISLIKFKYLLDNFTNKSINIHSICNDINTDISSLMNLIDLIRPKITDRNTKSLITRLANILFQASPPTQEN